VDFLCWAGSEPVPLNCVFAIVSLLLLLLCLPDVLLCQKNTNKCRAMVLIGCCAASSFNDTEVMCCPCMEAMLCCLGLWLRDVSLYLPACFTHMLRLTLCVSTRSFEGPPPRHPLVLLRRPAQPGGVGWGGGCHCICCVPPGGLSLTAFTEQTSASTAAAAANSSVLQLSPLLAACVAAPAACQCVVRSSSSSSCAGSSACQ